MKITFISRGLLFGLVFVGLTSAGQAQSYRLNFGLAQPQDPSTLPVSAAVKGSSIPLPKTTIQPVATKISESEYLLSTGWEMAAADQVIASEASIFSVDFNTSRWHNATVPGTVLTTLVDQGIYPDPYYGLNNLYIPDSLCRSDWWYRLELPLPEESKGKMVWLLFNGINYKADIWLNGKLLGKMAGAFVRGRFDATPYLKPAGKNILAVKIHPPHNPGIPHEESSKTTAGPNGGQLCLDGPTFISSEGWDWVPGIRDRNIGLWQDVRLLVTGPVTLSDPQVITDLPLPDTTSARITVKTLLKNHSASLQRVAVRGNIGEVTFASSISLLPGESRQVIFTPEEFNQLILSEPGLWWPNGYGKQTLHTLTLEAKADDRISDVSAIRFGVRELSYELTVAKADSSPWRIEYHPLDVAGKVIFDNVNRVDAGKGTFLPRLSKDFEAEVLKPVGHDNNPFLVIRVNGIPIFCKGGNWGMDDGMKRVSRERLEPYFQLHKEAHFNMIRNWTGESTEMIFYELCDEYGMLVWNDFWLSTEGYNLNVNDNHLFIDNATDVVRRFRNHPSIAVWCPRNEGYAPVELEKRLVELLASEDGTRHYAPNSRNLNLRPSGPWHYLDDAADYFRSIAEGFSTELGTPSVPTAATIRFFIPEPDQWPISDAWYYHDLHNGQKEYVAAIERKYGKPHNLDDFCLKAQMVNYDSHRAMFESWNSKMWENASGLLLWMSHPAWPSTVWQTYSWDYETFGSYFGVQKACEPLHIQFNLHDRQVVVINASLKSHRNLKARLEIFDLKGKLIHTQEEKVDAPANQMTHCFGVTSPFALPRVYLIRLSLLEDKHLLSGNDYWMSNGSEDFEPMNKTEDPKLSVKEVKSDKKEIVFEIRNQSKVAAIALKFNLADKTSGKIILPARFNDGYINLLPGEKRIMKAEWDHYDVSAFDVICEGYNVSRRKIW